MLWFLACVSGIFLGLAWIAYPLFAFVGFVPLLYLAGKVHFWKFAKLCFLAFLVWHSLAVWWLPYTDPEVGYLMFLIVSALFCLPMCAGKWLSSSRLGIYAFPVAWIAYEYLQYQWDFLWSWLTLGNALACQPAWIAFYGYTGNLGGSLWIWAGNLGIYTILMHIKTPLKAVLALSILLFPIFMAHLAYLMNWNAVWKEARTKEHHVLILQPNIDPVKEKLSNSPTAIPPMKQALILREMVRQHIRPETELVIFPEAVLGKWFEVSGLDHKGNYLEWDTLRNFFDQYPNTAFLIGMNLHRWVHGAERNDYTAHKEGENYRKRYNGAMLYQKGEPKQYHFKSKRVPSGEYLPLPHFLKPILPAISQTITTESPARLLITKSGIKIGALICYESTFGNHAGEMCRQGADVLCVITEDGYWNGTSQPRQHLYLDQIRALEHSICLLRASSCGLSGFINAHGELEKLTPPNQKTVVSLYLKDRHLQKKELTFYSKYGDWIGILAICMFLIASVWHLRTTYDVASAG